MTKEVNFTVPWLDKLKPPAQREDYRDKSTRGLQLRVSPTGVKSFDDGAPTEITMSLSFKETELLTKQKINDGF